ncbi:MAG: hypothetical protein NTZ74_05125 [Chloroflexi bacterium]|nr:hypothetical protein [Chloroflexota bacterium]
MKKKSVRGIFVSILLIWGLISGITPVYALGTPQIISISPGSPQPVGTQVTIRASVTWDNDFRSMRICFRDTNWCQEDSTPDITKSFNTSGLSAGTYTILVQVASKSDNNWSSPTTAQASYELTQSSQPSQPSQGPGLSIFSLSRSSATVGDQVTIHIKVNSSNPGATKINVSCGSVSKIETSEVEFDSVWYTNGCGEGNATATAYSRAVDDPDWVSPTVSSSSLYLSNPQSSVASPTANFYADSTNINKGNCTNIHWSSSNANSVDIDGSFVDSSGSQQVCPTVTKKYTLTAHGQNSDASRNLTIVVSTQQSSSNTTPSSSSSTTSDSQTTYVPFNQQFPNGHIIEIYGNIYVIVDFQRHLVPNPDTLDALGISRDMINNKGYSPSELEGIPQGSDIPDVNRDSAGFLKFISDYLSDSGLKISSDETANSKIPNCQITSFSTNPASPQPPGTSVTIEAIGSCDTGVRSTRIIIDNKIVYELGSDEISTTWNSPSEVGTHNIKVEVAGWGDNNWTYSFNKTIIYELSEPTVLSPDIPSSTIEQIGEFEGNPESGSEDSNSSSWFCKLFPSYSLCKGTLAAEVYCSPQCVTTARKLRDDMSYWIPPNPNNYVNPLDILNAANQSIPFQYKGISQKVRVLTSNDIIQHGDLVIWPIDCGGVPSPGHIGYVDSAQGILITIIDSNWGKPISQNECSTRQGVQIQVLPCMKFISLPEPVNSIDISLPPENSPSAQPTSTFINWLNEIFAKLNNPIN